MTTNLLNNNLFEDDTSDSLSNGVPSLSSLSFEGLPPFPSASEGFEAAENISSQSKKIRKKRNAYQKIDDDLRLQLLEAVQQNGETLKAASKRLNINYSSAKSIIHTFRKEGRILKKSALERTLNFCQYPLVEVDMNRMGNYAQFSGLNIASSEHQNQSNHSQASIYSYNETSLSSPMIGLSDNFNQLLLGSNIGSQNHIEEINIPKLLISEPNDSLTSMKNNMFNRSQPNSQADTQDPEIPALNLDGRQEVTLALDSLRPAESFYMNYSNSPLSGGSGNIFKDGSDSSSRRRCQKEFESFSELVNAFQNQHHAVEDKNIEFQIPSLFRYTSSQSSKQDNIMREDGFQLNDRLENSFTDNCKGFMDTQSVLYDALKETSFLNNIVQMRMASAGGNFDKL